LKMSRASFVLALSLLVSLAAAQSSPVGQTITGELTTTYTLVDLNMYSGVLRYGANMNFSSTPFGCAIGCFTDVAAAYPDISLWRSNPKACKVLFSSIVNEAVAYIRPESLHLYFYKTVPGTCSYTFALSGDECEGWQYGPNCDVIPSNPGSILLQPGMMVSFEGPIDLGHRIPQYSYVSFSYSAASANEFAVMGRSYDFSRSVDGYNMSQNVYDNMTILEAMSTSQSFTLEIASPPRLPQDDQRIPLFWSFYALPNNTANITISITDANEVECELENYGGRECQYYVPIIHSTQIYKLSTNDQGHWAPLINMNEQDTFSIGLTGTQGQVTAYLRYGNVPTSEMYDVLFPLLDTNGSTNAVQFYQSGSTVDIVDAFWFITFVPQNAAQQSTYYFWMNTACPGNCNNNQGTCADNQCTCPNGSIPVTCAQEETNNPTSLPARDREMTSTSKFFIVWGVFCGVGLIGLWAYLHYRRSHVASGYSNM